MDPLLLEDARKIESFMRATILELEDASAQMDATALRERIKRVAGSVQQLARLVMVLAESSDSEPLEFELPPDPATQAH